MKTKVWLVESAFSGRVILGRRAEDYLAAEFAAFDCERVKCAEECDFPDDALHAVIPLDMPLITAEDVERGAEYVRKHGLGTRFRRENSEGGGGQERVFSHFAALCKSR